MDEFTDEQVMIEAVAHNVIEVVLIEPVTAQEKLAIMVLAEGEEIDVVVSKSGRIISFEADAVDEVTPILNEADLMFDIAMIKHTTEYHIHNNVRGIRVDFE